MAYENLIFELKLSDIFIFWRPKNKERTNLLFHLKYYYLILEKKLYPTRMPSSISVGATESARSTTNLANCFTFIMYLGSSVSVVIIFVQRATCNGCSFCKVCLSAARSHNAGGAKPVSDSFIPSFKNKK